MTTNEIAAAVQAGHTDQLELWEAVWRFAHDQAYRWARALKGRAGLTIDDLMQEAFLALLEALKGWKADSGAFLTWYSLHLKAAFAKATGQRTQRDRKDPIHCAVSLDAPLTDSKSGEDFTLADVLEDPAALAELEDIVEQDWILRRHTAIEAALHSLPADIEATIRAKYYNGQHVDNKTCNTALRAIRNPRTSRALREYL